MKRGCLAAGVSALFFIFLFTGSIIYVLFRYESPGLDKSSFVEVRIGGTMPDYEPMQSFLGERAASVRDVLDILELARKEERVEGVVLRITPVGGGWAKTEEIRDAVEALRADGKKVFAYVEAGGDKEYYLASVADHIAVPPMTNVDVDGLSMELTFYRGTFDKVGVAYDGVHIGAYKSAPEHYTRKSMSDAYREELGAMADGLFNEFVDAVSAARELDPDQVRRLVDEGPFDPLEAKQAGLIDEVLYWDEFKAWVEDQGAEKDGKLVSAGRLLDKAERSRRDLLSRQRIAIVYVQGAIVSGENGSGFSGTVAGDRTLRDILRKIRKDSRIAGVVLRIDSPGGSVLASDNMWREIEITRQAGKPVVVSMADVAASGGYYIAAASDAVVAQPTTITGSIGIFTGKFVVAGLYDKIGLSTDGTKRGLHADLYSPSRMWTAEEKKKIRGDLLESYDVFVRKVADGRSMDVDAVKAIAAGRVWLGDDAQERGLVDRLGGLDVAIDEVKSRTSLEGQDVGIETYPRPRNPLDELFWSDGLAMVVRAAIPWPLERAAEASAWPFADGEPLALLPFGVSAD